MEQGSPKMAVVIDDERDIRDMVALALEHDGWAVRTATNGREALDLVRDNLPQMIVVDLMMSGMTGLEFCNKLLSLPGGNSVSVLLISGINEKARLLQDFWALPLRHKDFLRKPFSIHDLLRTIHGLIPKFRASALPESASQTQSRPNPNASSTQAPFNRPLPANPGQGPVTSSVPTPPPWMQGVRMQQVDVSASASGTGTGGGSGMPQPPAGAQAQPTHLLSANKADSKEEHKTGYRVLIVDDEPDIRLLMETAIGMYHTTATAENGMEALKTMDSFLPDFILSDINMPVMNGLDTAEAIRRHPVLFRVPIFFLSAERGADIPKRAYDVGGNLFLRKPVDPMRLINYIDFFLNETKLEPEAYWKQRASETAAGAAKPAASASQLPCVRILTVDFNIENHRLLKRLFGEGEAEAAIAGGPFELLWTEDPRTALGNLARWQPDVILYNPRNPGFDGVAFSQTLKLQKIMDQTIVLIGPRFYDADLQYAEKILKTPAIDNTGTEPMIARRLGEVVQQARTRLKPKAAPMERLLREDSERQQELQKANARSARERESFRQRYSKIQEFIDQNYR